MIIRYGEVSALQPDPNGRVMEYVRQHWEAVWHRWFAAFDDIHLSISQRALGYVTWPKLPPLKVNSLIVPTGSSRATRGVFLFDKAGIDRMTNYPDESLTLGDDEDHLVSFEALTRLPPIRITPDADDGVWAVVFYGRSRQPRRAAPSSSQFVQFSDESQRIAAWNRVLGVTLSSVATAYHWPSTDLADDVSGNLLSDVAAWSLGRRIVPRVGSLVAASAADAAQTIQDNLTTRKCAERIVAGYDESVMPDPFIQATTFAAPVLAQNIHRPTPDLFGLRASNWDSGNLLRSDAVGVAPTVESQWLADQEPWNALRRAFTFAGIADYWNTGAEDYVEYQCWSSPTTKVVPLPSSVFCGWHLSYAPWTYRLPDTIVVEGPLSFVSDPSYQRDTLAGPYVVNLYDGKPGVEQQHFQQRFPLSVAVYVLDFVDLPIGRLALAHWCDQVQGYVLGEKLAQGSDGGP